MLLVKTLLCLPKGLKIANKKTHSNLHQNSLLILLLIKKYRLVSIVAIQKRVNKYQSFTYGAIVKNFALLLKFQLIEKDGQHYKISLEGLQYLEKINTYLRNLRV